MLVELVTTGSELLLGEIVNENVRYLSQQLNKMGYSVIYQTTVGDNPNRMETVLRTALNRADIVITTGGLGPTQGDVTKIIGARVMGVSLVFRKDVMEGVTAWIKLRHPERDLTDNQRRQAMIPEGATVLANEAGTAPGTALYKNGKVLIHLPGPPSEMRWVFNNRVKTYLRHIFGSQGYIYSTYVKIYDMGEARIEDMIMDLVERQSNPTIAMYARIGFVEVRVTAKAADEETAKALVRPVEDELRKRLRRAAVTYNDETVAAALGRALLDREAYDELCRILYGRPCRLVYNGRCRQFGLLPRLCRDLSGRREDETPRCVFGNAAPSYGSERRNGCRNGGRKQEALRQRYCRQHNGYRRSRRRYERKTCRPCLYGCRRPVGNDGL